MPAIDKLVDKARSELKMRPSYPLGQQLALGSVGVVENGAFRYRGSIEAILGIGAGPELPLETKLKQGWGITSGKDVKLDAHAKGETSQVFGELARGRARVEVSFARNDSFLLAASSVEVRALAEPQRLIDRMKEAAAQGSWEQNFAFVYQIGLPLSYTVILSRQKGTKVLLSAAAIAGGAATTDVAQLAAGFNLETQTSLTEQLVGKGRFPAFYNAYRINPRWWYRWLGAGSNAVTAGNSPFAPPTTVKPFELV